MTKAAKTAGKHPGRRIAAALTAGAALAAIAAPVAQAAPTAAFEVQGGQTTNFGQVLVPVARTSANPDYFKLDASKSKADPGRTLATYRWDNDPGNPGDGDGFESTGTAPIIPTSGVVGREDTKRLYVTDNAGVKSGIATLTYRVVYKPEIAASAPATAMIDDPVLIDASKSKAYLDNGLAGEIQAYEWDEDNNGTFERRTGANSPQIVHKFAKPLTQCVKVRAIDQNGTTTDAANVCVKVRALPTASFTASPVNPGVNQEITLDASGSSDEGKVINYEWDLDGNGSFETNGGAVPTTKAKFAKAGPATVGLRVIDNDGDRGTTTMTIQVGKPATTTPPTGTPAPAPGKPATLALTLSKAKVKRGTAAVKVSCPAGAKTVCTGTLKVKAGGTKIGSARFSVPAGTSRTVKVKLAKSAPTSGPAQITASAKDRALKVLAASAGVTLKK